jgi:hypothetical protein
MMKRIKPLALWLGALVVIAASLLFMESDLLWKIQQYDLFLYTTLFFKQQMVVSGGMLSYLGSFFTQFFFYPWLGVLMLCGWWLLLMWLFKRTFCLPDRWNVLALIPVAILLTAIMSIGYGIYYMQLQGYFFVATIGTTAATALLWAFRKLPEKLWLRIGFIVLTVMACYPLMGVYALIAALLMGVMTWRLGKNLMQNIVLTGTAVLAVVAIPLVFYRFVYYQTNIIDIYQTALPYYALKDTYSSVKIPYYVLAVCFLAFVVTFRSTWPEECKVVEMDTKKASKGKKGKLKTKEKKPILQWTIQGALLAVLVAGVWHFWYKDDNFHLELRMQRCIERADWEGVIEEGRKQDCEPTRAIVMMHNLALSRLGRQCEEMYNFRKGSKRSNSQLPIYMYNVAGKMMYYQYGVINECHRQCMEEGVELSWNVELLQYLTRTALLSKEPQATKKYVNLLKHTLFYSKWADHMEKLMYNSDLLAQDPETGPVTRMMHYDNIQSMGNNYVEKNLMTMLSELDADDPYFQEQAVLAAMWTRNPQVFWPRFEKYFNQHLGSPIPRIMQEAAWLFGNLEQQDFVHELPIDKSVKDNLNGFMSMMKQYQGMPQMRDYLLQSYGNTYFFEYFFLRNITYY